MSKWQTAKLCGLEEQANITVRCIIAKDNIIADVKFIHFSVNKLTETNGNHKYVSYFATIRRVEYIRMLIELVRSLCTGLPQREKVN